MKKEITIEEAVLRARLEEETFKSIQFQIELNKMAQERDHYKSELEKLVEDKSKPKPKDKESTKK